MTKLCQVLTLEKSAHAEAKKQQTELYRKAATRNLFEGFHKRYVKKNEGDAEDIPAQFQKVQVKAEELLAETTKVLTPVFDLILTKDKANCVAKTAVTIDGTELLKDVPVTTLLFLEKELTDFRTFVTSLPTLDPADTWKEDKASGFFKTDPVESVRTKKQPRVIVKYEATDKHPAQTEVFNEDVVVGTYMYEKHSGAITDGQKKSLLERVNKVLAAVKVAREEANTIKVEDYKMGEAIFKYILG